MTKFVIYQTGDYKDWLEEQTLKSQRQIHSRILKIEEEGHFGHHKYLGGSGIWELKFNDGRRIYYALVPPAKVILLLGGDKNGQDKDIQKAAKSFRKINEIRSR
jgi:putative addiction module killer protein